MDKLPMTEFETNLVQLFNSTALPFEAKRYVVFSFFRTVEDMYRAKLNEINQINNEEGDK